MARLPTIKLAHKKTGVKLIINQTDYGRNVANYKDYKILSMRGGDATTEEIKADVRESKIEESRRNDPEREKWSGDKQRAVDQRKINAPVKTKKDWSTMKWPEVRKYIKEQTGTYPKSKKHAKELMGD